MMYPDPVVRMLDILKDTFKGGPFKEFYDGDPEMIPDFNLPCLIVSKASDTDTPATVGQVDVVESIVVKVIFNKKDDFAVGIDPLNMTEGKIREIIGQRDINTGRYLPTTVKGAISTKFESEILQVDQAMSVELGILPRANEMITAEGHVNVSVMYCVDID